MRTYKNFRAKLKFKYKTIENFEVNLTAHESPGAIIHEAIYEEICNLQDIRDDRSEYLEIIEIGIGYGILAGRLLHTEQNQKQFNLFRYYGIENDLEKAEKLAKLTQIYSKLCVDYEDFQAIKTYLPSKNNKILISTGLIQTLNRLEMQSLLTFNSANFEFTGLITFPLNIKERGEVSISRGNDGNFERSFKDTMQEVKEILKLRSIADLKVKFLRQNDETHVLITYSYKVSRDV